MDEYRHSKIRFSPPVEKTVLSVLYLIRDLLWATLASIFFISAALIKKCFSFMVSLKDLEEKIILVRFSKQE